MSDTPRTDALHAENAHGTDFFSKNYEKLKECSRQLERELTALKAENERLKVEIGHLRLSLQDPRYSYPKSIAYAEENGLPTNFDATLKGASNEP